MAKHIGIVACTYEGASLCYRIICREATKRMGRYAHPEITIHTHPPEKYDYFVSHNNWDGVAELVVDSAKKVAGCGAKFAICPDNTMHKVLEKVLSNSPIPWISIVEAVGNEANRRRFTKVGLIGTTYTMQGSFYPDTLKR